MFTGPGDTWAVSEEAKRLLGIPHGRLLGETISLDNPAEHLQPTPNPPGRKPLDPLHQSSGVTAAELAEILALVAGTDIAEQLVHWDHY